MTQFTGLPDAGIPWWLVFLPSWAAEFGTCVIILMSLSSSRLTHSPTWKLLQCATPTPPPLHTLPHSQPVPTPCHVAPLPPLHPSTPATLSPPWPPFRSLPPWPPPSAD